MGSFPMWTLLRSARCFLTLGLNRSSRVAPGEGSLKPPPLMSISENLRLHDRQQKEQREQNFTTVPVSCVPCGGGLSTVPVNCVPCGGGLCAVCAVCAVWWRTINSSSELCAVCQ